MASSERKESPPGPTFVATVTNWRNRKKFDKTFTEYEITVSLADLTWTLYKRFSEFRALHKELEKAFPRVKFPKFPPSRLLRTLNEVFIEERKAQLAFYLEELLAVNAIVGSPPLLTFLGAMSSTASEAKDISRPKYALHLDKVVEIAGQGDIFLFHTAGVLQSMQRTFTNSDYDHVGVVVRIPSHSRSDFSLFLLEATNEGVRKYPLKTRLRAWNLSKATICMRKLSFNRTREVLEKLGNFVQTVDGLAYGLTPMKLLRKTPVETQDNYFCSGEGFSFYWFSGFLCFYNPFCLFPRPISLLHAFIPFVRASGPSPSVCLLCSRRCRGKPTPALDRAARPRPRVRRACREHK